jgi:hypothetical protein
VTGTTASGSPRRTGSARAIPPSTRFIINHFGRKEETLEHNALQALFVDEDFRRRIVLFVLGGRERIFASAIRDKNSAIAGHRIGPRLAAYQE